jgi:hypothetical protein
MKTDNELIAEFMGVKEQQGFYDSYGHDEPFWYTANDFFRTHSRSIPDVSFKEFLEHCKYDTSWDWLMLVVERIDSMMPTINIPEDLESLKNGTHPSDRYVDVVALPISSPISEIYKAVVEFIIWYNQQKQ